MADQNKDIDNELITDDDNISNTNSEGLDLLDMSDEEFLEKEDKGELIPPEDEDSDTSDEGDTTGSEDDSDSNEDSDADDGSSDSGTDRKEEAPEDEDPEANNNTNSVTNTSTSEEKPRKKRRSADRSLTPEEQEALDKNIAEQTKDLSAEDYEKAYKELLKPLWARGHNFTPRNIDEVKTLMSQGVDYLYKTQQLAKSRKQVELLQRENISDEDLTFLVDLKKGDPEAIKKLLTDKNINPYDIDTSEEVKYQPRTQMVDDATLALKDSVNALLEKPDGRDCYNELVTTLDKQSQDYFLKEPQLLETFYQHQHIDVGNNKSLYTMIKEEIDHAKALGQLPSNTSFLDAYRAVGDRLFSNAQGQAVNQPSQQVTRANNYSTTAPEIHQRLGSVRNRANVSDRVRSAVVTPKSKARSKQVINPLDMPDDEFLRQFDGRL